MEVCSCERNVVIIAVTGQNLRDGVEMSKVGKPTSLSDLMLMCDASQVAGVSHEARSQWHQTDAGRCRPALLFERDLFGAPVAGSAYPLAMRNFVVHMSRD